MEEHFLINGLKTKNKIVFDFVFQYYYSGMCAFAESILKDEKAAEDLVQDIFVAFWVKSNNIEITGSLKNYLFGSVKNRCLDYIKHEKVKNRSVADLKNAESVNHDNPELWYAEIELREIIDNSLQKLPPRCREIFQMSRFKGLKNQEIANRLNLSKRTVELQISNALKVLRNDLKPYLPLFILSFLLK